MLLVVPCAFFVERLVFTFSDIRMQIAGFGAAFVVIWIFLSQVHPAFDLSNPFVILLAFVILALAIFVISIVSSRFSDNIRSYAPKRSCCTTRMWGESARLWPRFSWALPTSKSAKCVPASRSSRWSC